MFFSQWTRCILEYTFTQGKNVEAEEAKRAEHRGNKELISKLRDKQPCPKQPSL